MTAAELRALAERLCLVEPHDYEDRVTLEAAAEIIELIAWEENNKPKWDMWRVKHAGVTYFGNTFIGTLRRAREAAG